MRISAHTLEPLESRIAPAVVSTVHVWHGPTTGGDWSNASNWTNGVPTTGETGGTVVEFDGGITSTDDIPGLVVDEIHFTAGGNTINGASGVTLGVSAATLSTNLANDAGNNTIASSLPLKFSGSNAAVAATAGTLTLASATISGGFTMNGSGTVELTGTVANGATHVNSGTLLLQASGGPAIQGDLFIGTASAASAMVVLGGAGQIAPASSVSVDENAGLDLNTFAATIDNLTIYNRQTGAGQGEVGNGTLTVNGAFHFLNTAPVTAGIAVIFNTGAPVSGPFAGLPEGAIIGTSDGVFQLTYEGSAGAGITAVGLNPLPASTGVKILPGNLGATYTDLDGDLVTVKITPAHGLHPALTASDFTFGGTGGASAGLELQELNLSDASFNGASVAFTVKKAAGGDGLATVGLIDGGTNNFGAITVDGDLGAIDCGSNTTGMPAIKTLNVRSMGAYGEATQSAASASLESNINGALGALHVAGDIDGEYVNVAGSIGPVTIGGSIIGGAADDSGGIASNGGSIGLIKIGGDVQGGGGAGSGEIYATGALAGVTIGGSLIGGDGGSSGEIVASAASSGGGDLGTVTVDGNVEGGGGSQSGFINSKDSVGNISIHGSLIGGSGNSSGSVTSGLNLGAVTIGLNLSGGSGGSSGSIDSGGTLASVGIGGSLLGGSNSLDGSIQATGNIGQVAIGHNLQGGGGTESGFIYTSGAITGVSIGGSLLGGGSGSATDSGAILSNGNLGLVKVGHDVVGGGGAQYCGEIASNAALAGVTIGGSLIGGSGSGADSGEIDGVGKLGLVKIGGNVVGGGASFSGIVETGGVLTGVTIGGSLIGGGSGSVTDSGAILSTGNMGLVKVGHDLQGGGGAFFCGEINADGALAGVSIGGSLIGGPGGEAGSIQSSLSMGTVTIGHDVQGAAGSESGSILAFGALAGASIGGSVVGGSAEFTGEIFGAVNMGVVKIGGSLQGGSLPDSSTASLDHSGCIRSLGRIAGVTIGGSIEAGVNDGTGSLTFAGSIQADADIGYLTVGGSITGTVGAAGAVTKVTLSAFGPAFPTATSDLAFGKITIGRGVANAQILAGYNDAGNTLNTSVAPANGNAQIGPVTVGGNWIASDLIAGVQEASGASGFGSSGDTIINPPSNPAASIAKIASIVIKGIVAGSAADPLQTFAFESLSIGSMSINGSQVILPTAPGKFITLSPTTGDDVIVQLV